MFKISDFKIAENYIKIICKNKKKDFKDLEVVFEGPMGLENNKINIGSTDNLGQTIFNIISVYWTNSGKIYSEAFFSNAKDHDDFLITTATIIRKVIFSSSIFKEERQDHVVKLKMSRNAFIWLLFKNLICPVYHVPLQDIDIITYNLPTVDVAKFVSKIDNPEITFNFVFENLDVENDVIRQAFMVIELLRAYGLEPHDVINEILNSSLLDKVLTLANLVFLDESEYFMSTLCDIIDIQYIKASNSSAIKTAQSFANPTAFWYLGIIEQMLEPSRGPDIEVHEELEKDVKLFWDEVEAVKKQRHNEGVPFDVLLRIKSKGTETEPNKTLQSLLSSVRIWQ